MIKKKKDSKETRRRKSIAQLGNKNGKKGWFRKGHTLNCGEKNYFWSGGTSREPYTVDWTITLKKAIRQRDRYTCQACGKEPSTFVHHIDYDKKNCEPENLITLCGSCHSKTNFNRKYWKQYFRNIWRNK